MGTVNTLEKKILDGIDEQNTEEDKTDQEDILTKSQNKFQKLEVDEFDSLIEEKNQIIDKVKKKRRRKSKKLSGGSDKYIAQFNEKGLEKKSQFNKLHND